MRWSLIIAIFSLLQNSGALFGQQPYFQQEVNVEIDVTLNDDLHQLTGQIRMEYINHSPDILEYIYMHHWPNAYSSAETPLAKQLVQNGRFHFQFSGTENQGAIYDLDYQLNGVSSSCNNDELPADYCRLDLNTPLLPGDTVLIETPFTVDIPGAEVSRFGHDGQAYYITQWYPKPAVYDRNGWHPMSYLSIGEFYSEFGSYAVNITLPANYVVLATGELQNPNERQWLMEKDAKTRSIQQFSDAMAHPPSDSKTKTLQFKQDQIHDFAWFADKRYHVLYDEAVLPYSGDTVEVWSAFTNNEADLWMQSPEYLKNAIESYSRWNGDYPYSSVAAVDGVISEGTGMEYPMITLIGESDRAIDLESVIVHEVGHNWFYGILASNERKYPWLDEGINSANDLRYTSEEHPDHNLLGGDDDSRLLKFFRANQLKHRDQYHLLYLLNARSHVDQPISLPSTDYTPINYGGMVYGKSALIFDYLRRYLGDEQYDEMMKAYFRDWQFKHPGPDDFMSYVGESLAHQDYWVEQLVYTTHKTDFKASGLKKSKSGYDLQIKNRGRVRGPVELTLLSENDSTLHSEWIDPFGKDTTIQIEQKDFHRAVLDYNKFSLDINRKNNSIRRKGILKKAEPLRFQLFTGVEEPERTTIYYSPLIGYNTTDQLMAGLLLHNHNIFQKRLEVKAAPMYGFGSERMNWMASARYNFRFESSRWIENLWFELNTSSFSTGGISNRGNFAKGQVVANLDFKRNPQNRNLSHHLHYTLTGVQENFAVGQEGELNTSENLYGLIQYQIKNRMPLRPYQLTIAFDLHEDFDRLRIEAKGKLVMNNNERAIKARVFFGSFAFHNTTDPRYNFRMDGIGGPQDFRYDHVFPARFDNSGFLSQHFVEGHGNFKVPTASGQSNEWLGALNLKLEAPVKIPVGAYADIGVNAFQGAGTARLLYNAGLYVWIVPDAVEVYFPIIFSEEIQLEIESNGLNYGQLIRFMINFNEINPFNVIRNIRD